MAIGTLPARTVLKLAALKSLVVLLLLPLLSSCTSLFFQPSRTRYPNLELDRLSAQTQKFQSADGTTLSGWILKTSKPTKGVALQFHGNAQNMTTHYRFMIWLLNEGWDVLTFDYRGYGDSEGNPSNLEGVRDDGIAALKWAEAYALERKVPSLIVFGQSLGGNIAVSSLSKYQPMSLKALVLDSTFYSFCSIAREKLSDVWFLWPLQPLAYVLVSNTLSASSAIEKNTEGFKQLPALFLHSNQDPVVSSRQGRLLFDSYPGPRAWLSVDSPGHVNAMEDANVRMKLLKFLETQELPDNP